MAVTTTVYSQKTVHVINIDPVTHEDAGPSETPYEQNKRDQLVSLMDDINSAKLVLKEYILQELQNQPVDKAGKQAAVDKLQELAETLVGLLHPEVSGDEKAGMVTDVVADLVGQCKCEADAALKGIPAHCKRTTQETIEAAMS